MSPRAKILGAGARAARVVGPHKVGT